jgi:hypothetical protein
MEQQSVQARIEQGTAQLRALFPQITECHAALVQWREGQSARYSLHLDIRWPQHQTLLNGAACDSAEAAIEAGLRSAKERLHGG